LQIFKLDDIAFNLLYIVSVYNSYNFLTNWLTFSWNCPAGK